MDDCDTSSILYVEPYPPRQPSRQSVSIISTPEQQRLESLYDRFLMATTGVKRVGKGYQSDYIAPTHTSTQHEYKPRRKHVMPPPVSSDDMLTRPTMVVDELGAMAYTRCGTGMPIVKDESNTTVAMVRRAIKSMVPGKTVSKRRVIA